MICALSVGMLAGCGSSETQNQATGSADNTQTAGTETVAETKTPEAADDANLTATQQIITQAEGMTLEELAQKAIEESNGKTFYGVGISSRGKAALPLFIEYLQSIDPSYSMEFDWQQPKNNKIFEQLTADSLKSMGTFAMTLIQDGNQIESKMVQTGILDTFIPKDWADANGTTAEAKKYAKAADAQAKAAIAAAEGDYKAAAQNLDGYNVAVAQVMSNNLSAAKQAISKDNSADADYLRAVIAAKEVDLKTAEAQLKSAVSKYPKLAQKAANDINLKALNK